MRLLLLATVAGCGAATEPSADDADAGFDPDAGSCSCVTAESSLDGVRFDLCGNRCVYTLAEAAAGISFAYRTVVEREVSDLSQEISDTRCDPPDPSGLLVELAVGGGEQGYCMCDCGLGPGGTSVVRLDPGTYPNELDWDGTNWSGPSDYMRPHGPAFPAGTYRFTAHAEGTSDGTSFAVDGTLELELVP